MPILIYTVAYMLTGHTKNLFVVKTYNEKQGYLKKLNLAFGCHPPVRASPGAVRTPRTPIVTPLIKIYII